MSHAEVRGRCRRRHTGARHAPRRPRGVPRDGGAGHGAAGRRKAARHDMLPPLGYRVRGKGGAAWPAQTRVLITSLGFGVKNTWGQPGKDRAKEAAFSRDPLEAA